MMVRVVACWGGGERNGVMGEGCGALERGGQW